MLEDVQNHRDERNIPIDQVGIRGLKYPIHFVDRLKTAQQTVATFNLSVDLSADYRGIHMSRFVEIIHEYRRGIDLETFSSMLEEIRRRLGSSTAILEVEFPLFLLRKAPRSELSAYMDYPCRLWGKKSEKGIDLFRSVKVPVVTLCPCSKQISERGAHNQRALLTIAFRSQGSCAFEEVIEMAELSSSSPVYPLVKRCDEKFLTELAYDHPRFVEDVVRELSLKLNQHPPIHWYTIEAESTESIHNHNAYAFVKFDKRVTKKQ